MTKWISLNDCPPNTDKLILGCDWYYYEYRIHVCDPELHDAYWCGEPTGKKILAVHDSICPKIGHGESPYWMEIPSQDDPQWKKFDIENPSKWEKSYHEILISLHNGDYYTGFIESFHWCPSFNMFKYGSLEAIAFYMELPDPPPYLKSVDDSEEEKARKENLKAQWFKKLDKRNCK